MTRPRPRPRGAVTVETAASFTGSRVLTGGLPAAKEGRARDLVGMTSPTIYVRTVLGIDRL